MTTTRPRLDRGAAAKIDRPGPLLERALYRAGLLERHTDRTTRRHAAHLLADLRRLRELLEEVDQ